MESALRGRGLAVRRVDSRDVDHARELARDAARTGETVAVRSGDGLLGVVADELGEIPGSLLAVLPGGRGNDLARVLEIPDDPAAACETVLSGRRRQLDLGVVSALHGEDRGRAFVGIASAGFDSDANRIPTEAPPSLVGLSYPYGAFPPPPPSPPAP